MQVFLHIGFGKTGTTTMQHYMLQKAKELANRSILFPETGRTAHGGHHALAIYRHMNMEAATKQLYAALAPELKNSAQQKAIIR
jgi:hypothetical protein